MKLRNHKKLLALLLAVLLCKATAPFIIPEPERGEKPTFQAEEPLGKNKK